MVSVYVGQTVSDADGLSIKSEITKLKTGGGNREAVSERIGSRVVSVKVIVIAQKLYPVAFFNGNVALCLNANLIIFIHGICARYRAFGVLAVKHNLEVYDFTV